MKKREAINQGGWRTRFFEFYTLWKKESAPVQPSLNQHSRTTLLPLKQRQFIAVANLRDPVVRKNRV